MKPDQEIDKKHPLKRPLPTKAALSDEVLLTVEKPARYIGNEINSVKKDKAEVDVRFCICFPDVYEIGMSYLGIQIIYDMLNKREDVYCERAYSPWVDLDAVMREKGIPLFALESGDPICEFDLLGITLQYEMCYTNVLQILDLSQIPLYAGDRDESHPIVVGGGPCAYNPEPIADFFDLFYIGEAETALNELVDAYRRNKGEGGSRRAFLEKAAEIEGVYVPSFYDVEYKDDGTVKSYTKNNAHAKDKVKRQIVRDLNQAPYPDKPLVPYIQVTQDRMVLEIQRGCIRGCRFCQAGMIYRPIRERSLAYLKDKAARMFASTGHDEISLSSLSSSDYTQLPELIEYLIEEFGGKGVNISLPSLRIDAFALEVMGKVQDVRKSSLTFAPEAGTKRMRDVINKGLTEEDVLRGAGDAFRLGWNRVKLYFMLGLPTEEMEDVEGIAALADKVVEQFYTISKEERNGRASVGVSASLFVPKPFTPFQWAGMASAETLEERKGFLYKKIKQQRNARSLRYQSHDTTTSLLEGAFARGDRRLSEVVYRAYQGGCLYDSWSEHFKWDVWEEAFRQSGLTHEFYTERERGKDEVMPWDVIDAGVTKDFLWREYEKAKAGEVTPNCRAACAGCGVGSVMEG